MKKYMKYTTLMYFCFLYVSGSAIENKTKRETKRTCSEISFPKETTEYTCELDGKKISCDKPKDGTKLIIKCTNFYEDESLQLKPSRYCLDGSWDFPMPQCKPVCGLIHAEPQKLILQGSNPEISDLPWHVGLYKNIKTKKEFICGGSLLSEKITITAAHCFEDDDPKDYYLAAGKYYRKYDDPRDEGAQYSAVAKILLHKNYNNGEPNFAYDIALLTHETPFKITKFTIPVCFDATGNFDISNLNEKVGALPAWTLDDVGKLSETLTLRKLKYKDEKSCKLPVQHKLFYLPYAVDKMCAEDIEGKSNCPGIGGSSLSFRDDKGKYYIRGIASNSPISNIKQHNCGTEVLLLTSIFNHLDFILKTLNENSHT